jgi:hypothetical protein
VKSDLQLLTSQLRHGKGLAKCIIPIQCNMYHQAETYPLGQTMRIILRKYHQVFSKELHRILSNLQTVEYLEQ